MLQKNIMLLLLLSGVVAAQSFQEFQKKALHLSPYLKANQLETAKAQERNAIVQRYKNPTLALEVSQFDDSLSKEKGYRAALSQPLRLWGVGDDIQNYTDATMNETNTFVQLQRAEFIRELSLLYIEYVSASKLYKLAQESLGVAQKIEKISQERFEAGTIARVKYLQARLESAKMKNIVDAKRVQKVACYYRLLRFSGLQELDTLQTDYRFEPFNGSKDPLSIAYLESQRKTALSKAQLLENKVQWLNLYGEYEKEPDQNILRVGIEVPLAVFNTKKEERSLAKLKAQQSVLMVENEKRLLSHTLRALQEGRTALEQLLISTQELYLSQRELLGMYEDGYKIANVNLLELQSIKNEMIQTQEKKIQLEKKIQQNIVQHNYVTGAYNE